MLVQVKGRESGSVLVGCEGFSGREDYNEEIHGCESVLVFEESSMQRFHFRLDDMTGKR